MKKAHFRILLGLVILALAWVINRYDLLEKTLAWIESFGAWGPVAFVAVFALACIFFVPFGIFAFSSGALFGLWKGMTLSLIGNATGSLIAFLVARYLAHDFVQARIAGNVEFQRLSAALRRKGWKVILLARFSPVFPFSIGNYAFGVSGIKARHYFAATLLGTIPSALVFAYVGFITGDLAELASSGRTRTLEEWVFLAFGLVATIALTWYLRRIAEK